MKQLGELLGLRGEFARRGVDVIAVAKEQRALDELAKAHRRLRDRWFAIGGGVAGEGLERYAPTTGYLIDAEGVVRQVMPMETYHRPSWWAVLHEIDARFGAAE